MRSPNISLRHVILTAMIETYFWGHHAGRFGEGRYPPSRLAADTEIASVVMKERGKMAHPDVFSLPRSEYGAFLFASIGEESNGMALSVVSALARLDFDPWQEAARLTDLPKHLAAEALGRLIGQLPDGRWNRSDSATIAAGLVELLPRPGPSSRPGRAKRPVADRLEITPHGRGIEGPDSGSWLPPGSWR